MDHRKLLHQLRILPLLYKMREIHYSVLTHWISHNRSQPLTISRKSAMVFAPHQDDETLGCGGMIALKRKLCVPVRVVFLTDGQASHDTQSGFERDELVQIRKQEALTALTILGIKSSEITFLDLPDGTLDRLSDEQRQLTIGRLTRLLLAFRPEEVYVPHRRDRHKDHEATYELVQAAILQAGVQVELLQYPVWIFWKATLFFDLKSLEIAGAYRLPIDSVRQQKEEAIKAYRSQPLPHVFLSRFFLPYEIFFKTKRS